MKKFLTIISIAILPVTALAQNFEEINSNDYFAFASIFAGNFSLLLSIIIGIFATFFVFRSASKLGGGLFGIVLNYIGIGMLFVVFGTVFTVVDSWFSGDFWFGVISTACFALGYIFMAIGANKLLKGIMNT